MTQGRDTSEFNNLAVSTIIIEFDNAIINYIIWDIFCIQILYKLS